MIYILTSSFYENIDLCINLFSIIVFLIYVPVHNRRLDNNEHKIHRIVSLILLILYIWLSYTGTHSSIYCYLILIVTILIIAGIKKYEVKSI